MAKIRKYIGILGDEIPPGPYQYEIKFAGCAVELSYQKQTGKNLLSFIDDNYNVPIDIEYDEGSCVNSHIGVLSVIITADSGNYRGVLQGNISNPCHELEVFGNALSTNGIIKVVAVVSGGTLPLQYFFEGPGVVETDGVSAKILQNDVQQEVLVKVRDGNNCEAESIVIVPGLYSASPILKDAMFIRDCDDDSDLYYDVLEMGNDADGTLNLQSIELTEEPTKGSVTIEKGVLSYNPNGDAEGFDFIKLRVRDNSGNWSNEGNITIQHTPCKTGGSSSDDAVTIDCQESRIIDVLANDFKIDPESIEVISPPIKGTYSVKADGTIKYSHAGLESGMDVLRYRGKGFDGKYAEVRKVVITINPCCDVHDANLNIACNDVGNNIVLNASKEGDVPGLVSDLVEFCVEETWTAGLSATIAKTGVLLTDTENIYSGAFSMDAVEVDNSVYSIKITAAGATDMNMLTLYNELFISKSGVAKIGSNNVNTYPSHFIKEQMFDAKVLGKELSFYYTVMDTQAFGEELLNPLVANTHAMLLALTEETNYTGTNIDSTNYTVDQSKTVKFRRTITRTGCDDIEILVEGKFDLSNACSTLNITKTGVSSLQPVNGENFTVEIEGEYLYSLLINNEESLENHMQLESVDEIENHLNEYLRVNNLKGSVSIIYSTDSEIAYIQVYGTLATFGIVKTEKSEEVFEML